MKKIIALIEAGVITEMDVIDYVDHLQWVEYMKNCEPSEWECDEGTLHQEGEECNCPRYTNLADCWDGDETDKSLQ